MSSEQAQGIEGEKPSVEEQAPDNFPDDAVCRDCGSTWIQHRPDIRGRAARLRKRICPGHAIQWFRPMQEQAQPRVSDEQLRHYAQTGWGIAIREIAKELLARREASGQDPQYLITQLREDKRALMIENEELKAQVGDNAKRIELRVLGEWESFCLHIHNNRGNASALEVALTIRKRMNDIRVGAITPADPQPLKVYGKDLRYINIYREGNKLTAGYPWRQRASAEESIEVARNHIGTVELDISLAARIKARELAALKTAAVPEDLTAVVNVFMDKHHSELEWNDAFEQRKLYIELAETIRTTFRATVPDAKGEDAIRNAALEAWLRKEAAEKIQHAKARRQDAAPATEAELKAAHTIAQQMAGRRLPKISREQDEKNRATQLRIAKKLEAEASMILAWADTLKRTPQQEVPACL